MFKKTSFECPKSKVKSAISNLIRDNDVASYGELTENDNGFHFTYDRFGKTTFSLILSETDTNKTEVEMNLDIATTHKIVLTDDAVNRNFDKYNNILIEKYL